MLDAILAKVFGTKHEREIKAMRPPHRGHQRSRTGMQALSDAELAAKTLEFKQQLANGATLDDIFWSRRSPSAAKPAAAF